MAPSVEVVDLSKRYGRVEALRGVTLSVEPGQVFGLLGQNGAGKTTLVKSVLALVRPTSGTARILGIDARSLAARRRVGYLPEDHRLPEYHTAESLLDFLGGLSGMSRADRRRRIPELLDRLSLADRARTKIRGFSKGMRQRVGLAQALLHDPEVLFLDEPTDGVDPVGRREIRELLSELKGRGRTVFVNSHILGEVEMVSDRVAILSGGALVREGTVEELTRAPQVWEIRIEGPFGSHLEAIRAVFPQVQPATGALEAALADAAELNRLIDLLRSRGLLITGVTAKRTSLEDVYLQAVGS